jgi:hypothetical protein
MKKHVGFVILIVVVLVVGVVVFWMLNSVTGSGVTSTEMKKVAGFRRIRAVGPGELVVKGSHRPLLMIRAEDNILPHIRARVEDGVLHVGLAASAWRTITPTQPIVYTVDATELAGVELVGNARLKMEGLETDRLELVLSDRARAKVEKLEVKELEVRLSGSAECDAAGQAGTQNVTVAGPGEYRGKGLVSGKGTVEVTGVGSAAVHCKDELAIRITTDGGSVIVYGDPEVTKDVAAGGMVVTPPAP